MDADLPDDGASPGGRARWGRLAAVLVLGVLLAVGIGLLVGKAAGYETVLESLRRAAPAWLAVCLVGEVVAYAGYVAAFRGLAEFAGGPAFSWRVSAEVVFGSLGATRLLAAGGAGGLAFDFWALRKAGQTRDEAAVRVLGLSTLLYGVFGLVAVAAAVLVAGAGSASPALTVPWLVVVPIFAALAVLVSSPQRRRALAERRGEADAARPRRCRRRSRPRAAPARFGPEGLGRRGGGVALLGRGPARPRSLARDSRQAGVRYHVARTCASRDCRADVAP